MSELGSGGERCVHRMSLMARTAVREGWPVGGALCRGENGKRWIEFADGQRRELPSDWSWWWGPEQWTLWDQQRAAGE